VEPVGQWAQSVQHPVAEVAVVAPPVPIQQVPLGEFASLFTDRDFFTDKYQDKKE
jgi:hypothetical protein